MKDIALYISGQRADLSQGAELAISIAIQGTQPGSIAGAHSSRTFELPATKTNHAIFHHLDVARSTSDKQKQLSATIEINGVPVASGRIQVNTIDQGLGVHGLQTTGYKVAFFGNNADWFSAISNTLVRSLGWGDVALTKANYDSLGNADPATQETVFALVKWRQWELETAVRYTELTPCLSFGQILSKAFASIGYKFESCFDVEPFNRLIVPVPLQLDGDHIKATVNAQASLATLDVTSAVYTDVIFDDDSTPPNYDNGNNYDTTTGEYTAPISALYSVSVSFNVLFGTLNEGQNEVYILVNGTIKETLDFATVGAQLFTWSGNLIAGDVVTVQWYPKEYGGDPPEVYTSEWTLFVEAEKEAWDLGETLEYDYLIPGTWFVKDFISDATRIFNLAWETDNIGQTVRAYPKDKYTVSYRAGGDGSPITVTRDGFFVTTDATDITRRIDVMERGEMNIDVSRVQDQVFAWGTGDVTVENIEKRTASNLYSARYRFPTDRYPAGGNWMYTSYFAKTLHVLDNGISSGGKLAQIPVVYGGDYYEEPDAKPDYTLNPRLLYFAGRRTGDDGYILMYDPDTSANVAYDYPMAFQVNYQDASGIDFSLSFADELTNFGYVPKGLLKTFHMQDLKRQEVGKEFTLYALWPENEVAALSFRKPVHVGGDRYLLQEIEAYSLVRNRTARTRLLLDAQPTTADLSKIVGPVLLEGASPNGLTQLGAVTGVIGQGQTVTALRYYGLFENQQGNVITLPSTSGVLAATNLNVALEVYQNGQRMIPTVQYTVTGLIVTIDSVSHYDGATYMIVLKDVV